MAFYGSLLASTKAVVLLTQRLTNGNLLQLSQRCVCRSDPSTNTGGEMNLVDVLMLLRVKITALNDLYYIIYMTSCRSLNMYLREGGKAG